MSSLRGPWRLLAPLLALVSVLTAGLVSAVPASAAVATHTPSPPATCSSSFAAVVVAVEPENRVKAVLPARPLRTGSSGSVSPDSVRGFDLFLRLSTSGVTVYVNGDPVNLVDPTGHNPCAYEEGGCDAATNRALAASDHGADISGATKRGDIHRTYQGGEWPQPQASQCGSEVCAQPGFSATPCTSDCPAIQNILEGCDQVSFAGIDGPAPPAQRVCRYGIAPPGTNSNDEAKALCLDESPGKCVLLVVGGYATPGASSTSGTSWGDGPFPLQGGGGYIDGQYYSEHALERMAPNTSQVRAILEARFWARVQQAGLQPGTPQYEEFFNRTYPDPRGIPSSVVRSQIDNPEFDTGVRAVINESGGVVTAMPGEGGVTTIPDLPEPFISE